MPFKYRSKTEIIASILEIAAKSNNNSGDNKITKTKIMYKGFLSHAQVQEYLPLLIESGLLEHRKYNQTYRTTEKGLQFLNMYNRIGLNYASNNPMQAATTPTGRSSSINWSLGDRDYQM